MSIDEVQEDYVSKTEKKLEMEGIHDLALKLVRLSPSDYNQIAIHQDLRAEIDETKKIKSHQARRRQLRYLSHVINRYDPEEIRKSLFAITAGNRAANSHFSKLEKLRDKVALGTQEAIESVIEKYPTADRQHLRNLQRKVKKEKTEEAISRSKRVIYQYLRSLSEEQALRGASVADVESGMEEV